MNLAVTALAIFFSLATVPSPARAQTPSQTSWQLTPQAALWHPSSQWKYTSNSHVVTTETSNTLVTATTLPPIPPYVPCPGLYGIPQCCATDLVGLVALDCESPPTVPASPDDFRNICAAIGQQARCCLIPLVSDTDPIVCSNDVQLVPPSCNRISSAKSPSVLNAKTWSNRGAVRSEVATRLEIQVQWLEHSMSEKAERLVARTRNLIGE